MQGHKHFVDKVVLRFQLSERVPTHKLYRRLAQLLDWDFLYEQTQALYSHTGQPPLDPVVFFKLVLVGRLEKIASDHRLVEHCSLRLDILYFLGYEVDEDLPWHSTISRTRQLYPAAVFEQLFDQVFAQCVAAGLVAGDTQTVDSAPVKANASLDSVCEKAVGPTAVSPLHVAGQAPALPPTPGATGRAVPAHQLRYEAAWHRQRSPQGQRMRRVRQRTVEPVFDNLLQHYGLRRVGTKGKAAAHKTMLLSAIAYNLKKLLKYQPKRVVSSALDQHPIRHQLSYRFFIGARRKFTSSVEVSA